MFLCSSHELPFMFRCATFSCEWTQRRKEKERESERDRERGVQKKRKKE